MHEIDTFVDDRQIDLEEAIAAKVAVAPKTGLPLKVSSFVVVTGHSEWRVRKAIYDGHLSVDDRVRPMLITGGEMPITVREWQLAIQPATKRIKPSVMRWSGDGRQFQILGSDAKIHEWRIPQLKHVADMQRREIDAVPCARVDGGKK
jgi:hypothetical protein